MNYSTHTTVDFLAQTLLQRWVPKWYGAFCDPNNGGFYERLGDQFVPRTGQPRRLLTHCRQMAMYAHASAHTRGAFKPDLKKHFDHMLKTFYVPETGGWRFSVDDDGRPVDGTYDLYALSFVIFSMAHYYATTHDERAHTHALDLLKFIETHFVLPGLPGYAEAIDEHLKPIQRQRRQNPHMHLLEACLFAENTWGDRAFAVMADRMVDLFHHYFYIRDFGQLCEFFTDTLKPDPTDGNKVEPGHYCEWVWLLKKHAFLRGYDSMHDDLCAELLSWANAHGWDYVHGGIYDVLSPDGEVLTDSKRLWPFTEALKANALMLDVVPEIDKAPLKNRMAKMVSVFREHYMSERGFWVEWLHRDLTPAVDYMPGTTPYHVYFGIMETYAVMHARGRSVSWRAGILLGLYTIRRQLSGVVRGVKAKIKAG